ncbi:MAG: hypothetical protein AB1700_00230 [Bacillota bacterium]
MAQKTQKEAPDIVLFPHAEAVLKAANRKVVLVRQQKERDFVKVYTAEIRKMCWPGATKPLNWDEAALFFHLMVYLDYETNIVLSPRQCFSKSGERLKGAAFPASIKDIVEIGGRTKPTTLKVLASLEKKGLIKRVTLPGRDGRCKAIVLNPWVVFKGGQNRIATCVEKWEVVSNGEAESSE